MAPSLAKEGVRDAPVRTTLTCLFAGASRVRGRETSVSSTFKRVSRDVARARECPPVPRCTRSRTARNRNRAFAGNTICRFAGLLCKSLVADSNRRPPYHVMFAAIGRNPRRLPFACLSRFRAATSATACHRLRPLSSTNAPSIDAVWSPTRLRRASSARDAAVRARAARPLSTRDPKATTTPVRAPGYARAKGSWIPRSGAVSEWLASDWPFGSVEYAPRA